MLVKAIDPVLHTATTPVANTDFGTELQEFCVSMVEEMRKEKGIGLAAPQIGDSRSIFVMEVDGITRHVINPHIIELLGEPVTMMEGCLSYPDLIIPVTRSSTAKVLYYTPERNQVVATLQGMEARCFQHEFDHLQGVCFVDGLSQLKLELARKRGRKLRRRT